MTICPHRRWSIPGSRRRVSRKTEVRFSSIISSNSFSLSSTVGRSMTAPALFIRISTRLNSPSTASARARTSPGRRRSAGKTGARRPIPWILPASSFSSDSFLAVSATSAPASPKVKAIARPIPRLAPVTSAHAPFSSMDSAFS